MMKVLVFKTSISSKKEVEKIRPLLNRLMKQNDFWNFDLEDCDNILRVETQSTNARIICKTLRYNGFICEELF
ncbi:hypothetical protein M0G43_04145 [Subsaxibacter sp. CAU 1640]|nr:hypothetical protein [Subsaxibacter sp. CAU 1640]